MKIAVCGKGGVGKTTISAFLIKALVDAGRKCLAIDADPSPHLARVLGFPDRDRIVPIAEMKELLQERSQRNGPFYSLNPKVSDLPERFMLEKDDIKLMVLGAIKQGGAGCACADNAVLRNLLNILLLGPEEDIVLDMEAGVEHLGRGTIATVDHILVVVQPYLGSLETASKITRLSRDLNIRNIHLVANYCQGEEDMEFIRNKTGIMPLAAFPDSRGVKMAEREAMPVAGSCPECSKEAMRLVERLEAMM